MIPFGALSSRRHPRTAHPPKPTQLALLLWYDVEGRRKSPPSRYLVGESSAAALIPRVVSSAVPQNSSTKLHVTNLCIVWGSAGLPPMISFSASRSSGTGRRSAIITASVTMRCCGRGQRKTSVKVHFPGGPVSPPDRLTPYDRTVPLRNVLQKSWLQSYQRWTMRQPFPGSMPFALRTRL